MQRSSDFPKVTQLVNGRARTGNRHGHTQGPAHTTCTQRPLCEGTHLGGGRRNTSFNVHQIKVHSVLPSYQQMTLDSLLALTASLVIVLWPSPSQHMSLNTCSLFLLTG